MQYEYEQTLEEKWFQIVCEERPARDAVAVFEQGGLETRLHDPTFQFKKYNRGYKLYKPLYPLRGRGSKNNP